MEVLTPSHPSVQPLTSPDGVAPRTVSCNGHRFIFTRDLDQTPYGSHHLVLSAEHHTSHLLHRLHRAFPIAPQPPASSPLAAPHTAPARQSLVAATIPSPAGVRDRFEKAMRRLQLADHPHILQIEEFGWDAGPQGADGIGPFVISDYTGDADGIVTLDRLIKLKGGWLTLEETKRALEQVMGACAAAHERQIHHGLLSTSQIHVDRRGSLLIELYGLHQHLHPTRNPAAEEVRSIAAIGYQLATGLLPIRPIIPVEHMVAHADHTWRDYFDTGLGGVGPGAGAQGAGFSGNTASGVGFSSAAHALAAVHGLSIAGGALGEMGTSIRDLIRSMLTPDR